MFEADSLLKLLPPSIFNIYKVFEHIDMLSICIVNLHTIAALNIVRTLHGGVYHLVRVVILVNLVLALVTLALSILFVFVLTLWPSLCWHCRPCCAGVVNLVALVLPLSAA